MFEGILSPWHIFIVIVVVFVVFGPRRIAKVGKRASATGKRLMDGEPVTAELATGDPAPRKPKGLAARLGRRLARRDAKKQRKRAQAR